MPTIKFTDSQYEALLSILGYVAGEEKDLQERYDLPDNFEEVSNAKKIHMIHKVGATGHIYREILLLTMAIDGEEEEEEDKEEEQKKCHLCNAEFQETSEDKGHAWCKSCR